MTEREKELEKEIELRDMRISILKGVVDHLQAELDNCNEVHKMNENMENFTRGFGYV